MKKKLLTIFTMAVLFLFTVAPSAVLGAASKTATSDDVKQNGVVNNTLQIKAMLNQNDESSAKNGTFIDNEKSKNVYKEESGPFLVNSKIRFVVAEEVDSGQAVDLVKKDRGCWPRGSP